MHQDALLKTKLYVPPVRPELVSRPRLIERLNAGLDRKLTLISAPAGFGKTTLVSDWVAGVRLAAAKHGQMGHKTAWLSLDESDNDLVRFLIYLIAALQTTDADIGKDVLGALESPEPPPAKTVLTSLINEMSTIPDRIILVLDDYHLVESRSILDALTFLIEHLPPQMHLVIATREDPPLPLARLRARGQLSELRITDLRFTLSEATVFFDQVMGLNLSPELVVSLETRTEGWIAGLQLAALALQGTLSMQGREDVSGFVGAFAGDNRYIMDYLVEEVLQRQPERVRDFLLQTSILNRLSGPLCDAVRFGSAKSPTAQEESNVMLEALERGNLFVVPLDDKRQWYRYHHLFADVLQARSMERQPDLLPILHQRASEWYQDNGLPADAIRHAFAATDLERVAGLIELAWREMDRRFQSAIWLGWVKALPGELVRARPVLSAEYAWALLDSGELEAADARLRDAERWLDIVADPSDRPEAPSAETCPEVPPEAVEGSSRRMVVVDEEEYRTLPATIANARAYHAQALGDVPATIKYTRQALDLLPESDYFERGIQAAILGLAHLTSGDLESAYRTVADGTSYMQMAGNILFAISGMPILADIKVVQGRLREAQGTYEQALQLAAEQEEPQPMGTAELHLGLSEIHHEQGHLKAATEHMLRSEVLGEQAALPRWQYRWCLAQARTKEAQGDLDAALDLLHEAERLHFRHIIPDVRPVAALKTRVWVAQGRLSEAQGWVRERGLSVDDELDYLCEFEHVTLARVLIARCKSEGLEGSIHGAQGLLVRLLKAAEEGGRTGSVIEILVLQALAFEAQGDLPRALDSLERALILAEPEGHVRTFVDEGLTMAHLLSEAANQGIMPDYTARLLAVFKAWEQESKEKSVLPSAQPLIEPLSPRELEVLQLVAQGLSNREISERLFLTLNTVKGHNRKIYGKLGVHRRTEAVARARELGLL